MIGDWELRHGEIYDKHVDRRKSSKHKKKFNENYDREARKRRVSFKNYVREIEEHLLEQDESPDDFDFSEDQ